MSLFAHRFAIASDAHLNAPGRYDESRAVRVDKEDRPIVAALDSVAMTLPSAEISRPLALLGTRGELDPTALLGALATVTKADLDRDSWTETTARSTADITAATLLFTKTAGGLDQDDDRVPSHPERVSRVAAEIG